MNSIYFTGVIKLEKEIHEIASSITQFIKSVLKKDIYIGIAGKKGELYYIDSYLNSYIEFIQNFIINEFSLLNLNDYAPVPALNLIFYKPTEKIALVLFGMIKISKLLGFKVQLNEYGQMVELYLEENPKPLIEPPAPSKLEGRSMPPPAIELSSHDAVLVPTETIEEEQFEDDYIWEIPYLTKELKKKDKFPIQDSLVLYQVNNENTFQEIADIVNLPKAEVEEILKKYQSKGLIGIRIVEPEIMESDTIIYPKLIEPVSLAIGFAENERLVLENCTGDSSIQDIVNNTQMDQMEIISILDKYEEKGWLDFKVDGKPDYYPKNIKKLNPMGVQLGLMSPQEFNIRRLCTGDVTVKSISKSLGIDYYELLKILKKMEKEEDIILKIRKI